MASLVDRYYQYNDALDKVNNALELLNTNQESLEGKERINSLNEEIKLLKQKEEALNNLRKEQEKEQQEIAKVLTDNGFNLSNGVITNYQKQLDALTKKANSAKGEAKELAQAQVKALKDLMDRYIELTNDSIAETVNGIADIKNAVNDIKEEIKDIYKDQLDTYIDVEKEITNIFEKQKEERLRIAQEEKDARVKAIQDAKDAYNKQNNQEDYEKKLNDERRKLDELETLIANASLDSSAQGKAYLESLKQQYEDQKQSIEDMIKEQERDKNNDMFDEEIAGVEKEYEAIKESIEEMFSGSEIAGMVSNALATGVITMVDGSIVTVAEAFKKFQQESGDGFGVLGDKIQDEFVDKLAEAVDIAKELGTIMGELGIEKSSGASTASYSVGRSLERGIAELDVASISELIQPPVYNFEVPSNSELNKGGEKKEVSVNFNSPLLSVQGDITSEVMPRLERIVENVKEEIYKQFKNQLQLAGIF